MDRFKQLGKAIRKDQDRSALNSRRIQKNFPLVERKLDTLSGDSTFVMEFPVTDRKHSISLNLRVKPDNCCECEPGGQTVVRDCIAYMSPSFPNPGWDISNFGSIPTGEMQEAIYIAPLIQTGTNFNYGYNSPFFYPIYQQFPYIAGYELTPDGGIKVPTDGMYALMFRNLIEIKTDESTFLTTAVLQNDEVISRKIYSVAKGNLRNTGIGTDTRTYFQYASCVPLHKDDIVRAGLQSNAPYWRVYGGVTTDNSFRVVLLGLGYGTLVGTVKDLATGLPVSSATVSYSIGFGGSTVTDENGVYEFDQLTPGPYSITVSHSGYITQTRDVNVLFDDIAVLDFDLVPV